MYKRVCKVCSVEFGTNHPRYICCSKECGKIHKVNLRYERENGNWTAYFKSLLSKKKEATITPLSLVKLLQEQEYKCALSGVELSCTKVRGIPIKTNASIDRINPKGEYNIDNVQLVCRAVNSFRGDMEIDDFINWCNKVTIYAIHKQEKTL